MAFIRKIKKQNAIYLAEVENHREGSKVKQKVIRYIGKEVNGQIVRKISSDNIEVESVKQYLDYRVLHSLAREVGLTKILGEKTKYILLLIYTQIISRKPIYKLPEYVEHTALKELLGIDKIIDKQLYEALDDLEELNFERIETEIFERLSCERKERKALVLDVTDTYFAGSQADWKARRGKDGKYDKLIQIALAVTKEEGFPIMHKIYEGNINNVKIFQDLLAESRLKRFDVIVLDRGASSYETLADLGTLNQKVIAGLRLHERIKKEYISKIDRETIYHPNYQIKLKNTQVYAMSFDFEGGKLIAVYNPELEVAKRNHAMENNTYDPEEARYMGYSIIFHTTGLPEIEVVKIYYEKDIVEKAFKELKSSINLHPIRKYRMSHIKAHVKICYMAYALLTFMQYKLRQKNLSAVESLEKLQSAYKVYLKSEKEKFNWSKIVTLSKDQKAILEILNCSV